MHTHRFLSFKHLSCGTAICLLLAAHAPLMAGEFHVSPKGSDRNPGTKGKPFATLEKARDAVRSARSQGGASSGGMTIWLAPGDYGRTNTLVLTAEDSGTAEHPVEWKASGTARLLGGVPVPGLSPVKDAAILDRLDPAARGQVKQADLKRLGVSDFGKFSSRGFARPTSVSHAELFYAGRPMTLARWPDEGKYELIAGFPDSSTQGDSHGGKIGKLEEGFNYAGERPRKWKQTENIWIHGYWAWDWANSYERITSLDLEKHLVKTASPYGHYGFRKGQRIYFLNILEELDRPGEYYIDHDTGILYFWPPEAADSKSGELLVSRLGGPLITMTGVSHVSFTGLVLEAARGNAVEITGGEDDRILGCVLRNLGDGGVVIEGGTGHRVVGCDVFGTGDGGVSAAGGDRKTLTPGGHVVENCHFARQGRWSKCYVPAILFNGVGQVARNNWIHHHPHCGILFNGNDHLMEYNEIDHIALETGDVGAIYAGRNYSYRGNRVLNNYIHHTGGVGMGSMGVYMDDCISGTEISGNIFYKVHRAAFLGGGRDHRVLNNIFVECDPAVELDGRGLDKSPVWWSMVEGYMRDGLREVPQALYRERYPAIKSLDACYGPPEGPALVGPTFKGVPPEGNEVRNNVCVGKWLRANWNAREDMIGISGNLTDADPLFVRPISDGSRVGDFALQPGSPAFKSGFVEIPVGKIGLQKDQYRQKVD